MLKRVYVEESCTRCGENVAQRTELLYLYEKVFSLFLSIQKFKNVSVHCENTIKNKNLSFAYNSRTN